MANNSAKLFTPLIKNIFEGKKVFAKHIVSHAEYDKLNKRWDKKVDELDPALTMLKVIKRAGESLRELNDLTPSEFKSAMDVFSFWRSSQDFP